MRAADTYRAAKRARKKINGSGKRPQPAPPENPSATYQRFKQETKKLTVEDVDKAMEEALSKHWAKGGEAPLELSPMFAARARMLNWVEGVEFKEVQP